MKFRLTRYEEVQLSRSFRLAERAIQHMLKRAEVEHRRHGRALERAEKKAKPGEDVDQVVEETAAMASTARRVVRECVALLRIARENPGMSPREAAIEAELEAWQ